MIMDQPEDRLNILPGSNITFSVTVTGESLSYQWQKDGDLLNDGDDYTGAKTSTLTVVDVKDPDDEGAYNVIILNEAGFLISASVELSVGRLYILTLHIIIIYNSTWGMWCHMGLLVMYSPSCHNIMFAQSFSKTHVFSIKTFIYPMQLKLIHI